jgi:hypothetical protein
MDLITPGAGPHSTRWARFAQHEQHIGMLFIMTQQVQPAFIMAVMQAQQAWIIAEHDGSPLVQAMETPSSLGSHLQRPMVMLQQQTIIPFIMQQQLHNPPAIMVQRFCSIPAETLSSQ